MHAVVCKQLRTAGGLLRLQRLEHEGTCLHQDDDIPGIVRYRTYEVLKNEVNNPRLRWAYLPYSMHMAGPREAIQHIIIRKNYGAFPSFSAAAAQHLSLHARQSRMLCVRTNYAE